MEIIYGAKEESVQIPKPFEREITLLLGPDKGNIEDVRINLVAIPPGGKTGYHSHDRPEALFVISGEGSIVSDGDEINLVPDMLVWAAAGDGHQVVNNTDVALKLLTFFIPGFSTENALYNQQLKANG
jgi:quercetin dioxygenase-like cupin family protein